MTLTRQIVLFLQLARLPSCGELFLPRFGTGLDNQYPGLPISMQSLLTVVEGQMSLSLASPYELSISSSARDGDREELDAWSAPVASSSPKHARPPKGQA